MAKRDTLKSVDLSNPLAKTEPGPTQPEVREDPVKSQGVGLKISEWTHFEAIAAELGLTRHKLALWVMRDFMARYDRGEIETVTKKRLPGL